MRFIFFWFPMFLNHGIRKPIIIIDLARILRSEIRTYKFKISPCTVFSIFILIMNDCSSVSLWLCSHTAVVLLVHSQKKRKKLSSDTCTASCLNLPKFIHTRARARTHPHTHVRAHKRIHRLR